MGIALYSLYLSVCSCTVTNWRRLLGHHVPRKKVNITWCSSRNDASDTACRRCDGSENKGAVSPMLSILFLRGMWVFSQKFGVVSRGGHSIAGLFSFIDSHFSELTMSLVFEDRYFIFSPICAISAT